MLNEIEIEKVFICTQINKKISSKNKKIYILSNYSIDETSHLGEVHLKDKAKQY